MSRAFVVAARRTAVAPRGGAFRAVEAHDLAAPVLRAVLADAGLPADGVDQLILGNALSGGGNVARLAGLAAGLPDGVPALTLDTQCCAGLDAILLAARLIEAGAAQAVLAGGVESWSRAPLRARRPKEKGEAPVFYERPPFAPWPGRDPDPLAAAAGLAREQDISRARQNAFAVASHTAALAARERLSGEIVPVAGLAHDAFARALSPALCARAPVLAGQGAHAVDATGVAVEADAAAAVLVVSAELAARLGRPCLAIVDGTSAGGAPERPVLALVPPAARLIARHGAPDCAEIMEAFAAQALANIGALGLDPARVNRGGGALARGHPIGASGAILAVRLFHEMAEEASGALGLAAIAAAGGLASVLMLQRS